MNTLYKKISAATMGLLLCGGLELATAETVSVYERFDEVVENTNLKREGCIVPISFVVNVPNEALSFDNARIYTPVLVNGEWRKELPAMIIKGYSYRNVTDDEVTFKEDDADETNYYLSYTKPMFKSLDAAYEYDVKFEAEMRGAKLILEMEDMDYNRGIKKGKAWWKKPAEELEPIEVVQLGVVDFSHLEVFDQTLFLYTNKMLTENFDDKSVFYGGSDKIKSVIFWDKFNTLVDEVKNLLSDDIHVKKVEVAVSSSLDGDFDRNESLAAMREETVKDIMTDKFPELRPNAIRYTNVKENWDGFVEGAKQRGFYEDIRSIVESGAEPDDKEKMLRSSDFRREVIEVCIENRNCLITVTYTIPAPFTNKAGFKVCCMRNSSATPEDVKVKGDQYRLNNQMVAFMKKGQYVEAFEVYKKITLDKPEIINNKAVLLSFLGDFPMAKYYFEKVKDMECNNYNVALMYMLAGETECALKTFGDSDCHNAIVANISAGNYDRAIELTRESGYTDAKALYLRAIAYSYTRDADLTLFTLRQACSLDPTYKHIAKCQVEFMPLRDMAAYNDIVK